MFFTKGEIIMNNIYKVIWSKAKNCYVVASEIARSHTKSATGSEKIGGVTRRSLLASLMALSLLCGGLGVASAADVTVHVDASLTPSNATEVYTTTGVNTLLDGKADKAALNTKANATDVAKNTENIATNQGNIKKLEDDKLSKDVASATYATNKALDGKANTDLSNLTEAGKSAIKNTMLADMENKANKADVYSKTDADDTFATKMELNAKADATELAGKANKTDLENATNRITTNEGNITALKKKTANLTDDGKELTGMTTVRGTTVSGDNVEANALKVTGEISNGAGVTTTLAAINDSMTQTATNKTDIAALQNKTDGQQTAIDGLNTKTTQISYDPAKGTTVNDVEFKGAEVNANGKGLTGVTTLNTTGDATIGGALTAAGVNAGTEAITGGSLSVTGEVKGNRVDAGAGEIKTTGVVNAGTLSTAGNATVGGDLNATGKVSGKGLDAGTGAITGGSVNVGAGEIKSTGVVNAGTLNTTGNATVGGDLNATGKVSGKGLDAGTGDITGGSLNVTGAVKGNGVDAGAGEIKTTGAVNAGTLNTTGNATVGGDLNATGKVSGKGLDAGTGDITGGSLNVTGEVKGSSVDAGAGEIKTTGAVNAGTLSTTGNATVGGDLSAKNTEITGTLHATGETNLDNKLTVTGEATFKDKVTMEKDLEVKGELKTDKIAMENKKTDADGRHNSSTTITADYITHIGEVEKSGVTTKSSFTHNEKGSETYATKGDKTDWTETRSDVTADGVKTEVKDSKKNRTNTSQTADGIKGYATDEKGNKTYTKVTATENSLQVQDKDGKNKNHQVNTKDSSVTEITNADGKTTTTEQTATDITNTAKDGTIKNDAKDIVNNATGDMTNTVGGKLTTTVTGQATEDFNGGLDTNVKGTENHTVTGDQNIHVTGKQTNKIDGNQENTIGGNQTTTVEGKVTENYKGGQETNVTGNQDITVSGTQTTTATDINRNASSGMIDTIDNDYGTNKETKVAGETKTEVSIKGTDEKGEYIRGATQSRDYLIKGTLKNSETKTAEATSSEVTDGTNKASTIQDAKNLAGSVTNGTETGISGIHANNDGSVSIDSTVVGGGMSSVINQKKDSIQSAVGDGTNSTVIRQDKDNVTIASSKGMVAIGGKDIVNNAQDTITNTAGTSITNQVKDSTVTTDVDGTTFENKTAAVSDGGTTTTKINGNLINTGRVEANELGVSDKDDQGNTADFSVKAGEGIKGSVTDKDGNKTYTTVTATENSFQVQDKDGNIKNHQVNTKDSSENTITNGDKTNTVTSTADGTTFTNSKANTAFEGGTYKNTTIKGNTITTGKVTMDYAEVMKDLGVRGKTTTGSLEVTSTSTLTGDVTMGSNATVKGNFNVEGNTNLMNTKVDGTLDVTQKATFGDSVSIAKDLSVGGDVTAKSYKVGDKTYISADGINANDQKITNVADGSISEGSKDAVNGGQLYGMKTDLEHKVDKVGANAAAMANLHPMEFDPDSKWNIAAAMGNYGSETATAIGAFYRPNEDVMVNFSTAFGTGENMVGGGVSVRLGKGSNKLSREESNALKAQVNDLTARMDALLSVLNPNMSKDFPDVPENHWAYEAVSRLAGNDIVQGYPDGEFHGERTMTRYEMAEIIYNALSRGAEAERELVEEFKPELQAMAASEKATAERAEG